MDAKTFAKKMATACDLDDASVSSVESFEDAGVITADDGFVVRFDNGDEFQVTVLQSRFGRNELHDAQARVEKLIRRTDLETVEQAEYAEWRDELVGAYKELKEHVEDALTDGDEVDSYTHEVCREARHVMEVHGMIAS